MVIYEIRGDWMMARFSSVNKVFLALLSCSILWSGTDSQIEPGKTFSFRSATLGDERLIQVFLPQSYDIGEKAYPVIYVLDSAFLFEPTVTISKVRASRNLMPESIVVGIDNPTNIQRFGMGMPKKRTPTSDISFKNGKPEAFLAFLEKELIPQIENQYRTAKHRTLIGMSPTNGPVFTGFMTRPELFQAYLAMAAGPHFYTIDDQLLAEKLVKVAQRNSPRKGWFYISRGAHDLPHNSPQLPDAFTILQNGFQDLKGNYAAKAEIIPDGEHYASALDSLIHAFAFIYPKHVWRPDYRKLRESESPSLELNRFYENLTANYGFKTYPAIDGYWMGNSIGGLVRRLIRAKKYEQALKVLEWGLSYHPHSVDLHYYRSRTFEERKDIEKARQSAKTAMDFAEKQGNPDLKFFKDRYQSLFKANQK